MQRGISKRAAVMPEDKGQDTGVLLPRGYGVFKQLWKALVLMSQSNDQINGYEPAFRLRFNRMFSAALWWQ